MEVSGYSFQFRREIPDSDPITVPSSARCFAELILSRKKKAK